MAYTLIYVGRDGFPYVSQFNTAITGLEMFTSSSTAHDCKLSQLQQSILSLYC